MQCPNPKQLQQMLDETLPLDEQGPLQTHLETCPSCQRKLEQLAAGGVTWDKTARNLSEQSEQHEAALTAALEKLQDTPTSALQTQAEPARGPIDDDLSFLQPSQKPNSLGRLDEFEILSVIGKGGFGIVLKAFDESLHRIVAIKVMAPQLAANGAARQRFHREARAAAQITHENVVTIHKVSQDGAKFPYLAMQYISGVTLNDRIGAAGPLSVKEILRIGMQIAEGLAAAHKIGLVHRDIKPGNILLENGVERVKITDFGLARTTDDASVTQSGTVAGTPMYMSPEQANGEAVDHRSDLFSLGSVLYVMCTGRPPFRATTTMAVMKRVCDDTPTPVQQVNADIPDWLSAIVARLHAKNPADRYQTARAVADLLGQQLAKIQQPTTTAPTSESVTVSVESPRVVPKRRSLARRWEVMAPVAAGVIVVLVAVVWFGWLRNRDNQKNGPGPIEPEKILARMVGTWSIEVDAAPPNPKVSGKMRCELVANGKFLRAYAVNDFGRESLTVYGYDPQSKTFRRWFFASDASPTAIQGPHTGEWDAKTSFLTLKGDLPAFHKVRNDDVWWNADHFETRTTVWDHQGLEIFKQTKTMRRIADEAIGPKAPKDPKRRPEFTLLDRLVGSWTVKATVTLAELGDRKVASESKQETIPILGGRFVEERSQSKAGGRQDYTLVGYDEFRKTYRFWHFGGDGDAMEADGAFDKTDNKLTWKSIDGRLSGAWTFRGPDEQASVMAAKDAQGRRRYEVEAIAKRADGAAERWVQLFNCKDLTGWKKHAGETTDWKVEDGLLVGRGGHLFSERGDLRDFHLRAEVKINKAGEGSLFFRCSPDIRPRPTNPTGAKIPAGYAAEIRGSNADWSTGSLGTLITGWRSALPSPPPDQWLTLDIIATGLHMIVKVNGVTAVDTNTREVPFEVGHLALQAVGKESIVHFRKIEIKELPPEEPKAPVSLAFVDPDGDCQWKQQGKRITITVPGGDHHYSPKKANLPRLLHEVEGDFVVEVTLPPLELVPAKTLTAWGEHLIVWNDDQNVLVIQRVTHANDGKPAESHVSSNCFQAGKPTVGPPVSPPRDLPLRLKIERVGSKITTFYREEGKPWRENQVNVVGGWPPKLHVGLATSNGSKAVLSAQFDDFRVHRDTGWVPLFNGKDINGWTNNAGGMSLENGYMHIVGDTARVVSNRTDFRDFHLRLEAKYVNGEARLLLRGQPAVIGSGCEVLLGNMNASFHAGAISTAAAVTARPSGVQQNRTKPNEWLVLEVIAQGGRLQSFINGKKTADFTDPSDKNVTAGFIGFSLLGKEAEMHVKKLEIKELPPTAKAPVAETGVLDFAEIHDADEKSFDAWLAQLKKDEFRPVSVSVHTQEDAPRYTAVAVKGPGAAKWEFTRVRAQDEKHVDDMRAKNYFALAQCAYRDNKQLRLAFLWVLNDQVSNDGIYSGDKDAIETKIEEARKRKARPIHRTAFEGAAVVYGVVLGSPANIPWAQCTDETLDACKAWVEKQKTLGYRPDQLYEYGAGESSRLGCIAIHESASPEWDVSWALTKADYEKQLRERRTQGFRPQSALQHDTMADGLRFSVIWIRYGAAAAPEKKS